MIKQHGGRVFALDTVLVKYSPHPTSPSHRSGELGHVRGRGRSCPTGEARACCGLAPGHRAQARSELSQAQARACRCVQKCFSPHTFPAGARWSCQAPRKVRAWKASRGVGRAGSANALSTRAPASCTAAATVPCILKDQSWDRGKRDRAGKREGKSLKDGSFKGGSREGCEGRELWKLFFAQRLRGWLLNLVPGLK